MTVIGLSGKIGAGKDMFAELLLARHLDFSQKSFAFKLKQVVHLLVGGDLEDQFSHTGKDTYHPLVGATNGILQQRVGYALRRCVYDEVWINALFADYTDESCWVITDVRYPNEARAILECGGYLVRIDGTRITHTKRDRNHESETALDTWEQWDYRFDNSTGTLDALATHVHAVAKEANDKSERQRQLRGQVETAPTSAAVGAP